MAIDMEEYFVMQEDDEMKIPKEYLIFGVVLALLAVMAFLIISSDRKSYDKFQSINTDTSQSTSNGGDDMSGGAGTSTMNPGDNQTPSVGGNETPTQPGDTSTNVTEPPVVGGGEENEQGQPVEGTGDGDIDETQNSESDPTEGDQQNETASTEDYAYMMMYFVCGLEDSMFDEWMTPELRAEFNTHDEAPYSELKGNTGFSDIVVNGESFSFKAANGNTYSFTMTFNGQLVSGITPA